MQSRPLIGANLFTEEIMKQLSLIAADMYALQDEIVDVHQKIRSLEQLKDMLFKEREAICTHPFELRVTNNDALINRGTYDDQYCGICKKLMSTRNFRSAPTTQKSQG